MKRLPNLALATIIAAFLLFGTADAGQYTPLDCDDPATASSQTLKMAFVFPNVIKREGHQLIACCKICRKGKACGDSCIARYKTCHKGPGCACNG